MDINKLIGRTRNILMTPKTEWPVIADEAATVPGLYMNYVAIFAAIAAVMDFVSLSLVGIFRHGAIIRVPTGLGLVTTVVYYVLSLVMVYVLALIVDTLAPTFGSQRSPIQAFKTVAYAWIPSCLASIIQIIPWLGPLIVLAGSVYGIYLLFLGLQVTMKCPSEKILSYTAVVTICVFLLYFVIKFTLSTILGLGGIPAE